jgi:hypothetical protein
MSNVTPRGEMLLRRMARVWALERSEAQGPEFVPEHLREPYIGPARILAFLRPADRELSDVARASITTNRFRPVAQPVQHAEGEHGRGVDAVHVRSTEQPTTDGPAQPSTQPLASGSAVMRRPVAPRATLTPVTLRRRWTEREGEFIVWAYSLMCMLLGSLLLWGSLSAGDEGLLGTAFASAAMGAGLLLVGSALLGDGPAGPYLGGTGALLFLIGFVFLVGMFVGETEPVRPIEVRLKPWATTSVGDTPVASGHGFCMPAPSGLRRRCDQRYP